MRLVPISWDVEHEEDMKNGYGFPISNPESARKDTKAIDGIYSPLYGTDITDGYDVTERFRCKCRTLTGKFYENVICEECNTPVKYINDTIKKTGWMTCEFNFINPFWFQVIGKLTGGKKLENMINYEKDIDIDGATVNRQISKNPNPYENIGIFEFEEKFDEIMGYFKNVNKDKSEVYDFIMENKDMVFTNHIPVFSLTLRPIVVVKAIFHYSDINRKFALLLTNISILNKKKSVLDKNKLKVLPMLYNTQLLINEIHDDTLEMNISKKGHIRNNMLGIRVNFSSRCVITPLVGRYRLNEVVLPYLCFLELYKYEILNLLCQMDKCTLDEADSRWNNASQTYDHKIYLIMKNLINKTIEGIKVLINRNPTLNYGSVLICKVVDVKDNYDDLCLELTIPILSCLNADFDGDVMNMVCIKDRKTAKKLEVFDPINLCVDKNNGKFNRKMNLVKDQLIGLCSFCS